MPFGHQLQAILERCERNAPWLARKVGRTPAAVYQWLHGEGTPDPKLFPSLRDALQSTGATAEEIHKLESAYLGRPLQ